MAWQRETIYTDSSMRDVARRPTRPCSEPTCCGIVLDGIHRTATRAGRLLRLGRIEYGMLELMLANRGTIFTRKALIDILWERDESVDLRTVDVHVGRLRRALTLRCAPNPIQTIRSHGYAIQETCEEDYLEWRRHPAKLRPRAARNGLLRHG